MQEPREPMMVSGRCDTAVLYIITRRKTGITPPSVSSATNTMMDLYQVVIARESLQVVRIAMDMMLDSNMQPVNTAQAPERFKVIQRILKMTEMT